MAHKAKTKKTPNPTATVTKTKTEHFGSISLYSKSMAEVAEFHIQGFEDDQIETLDPICCWPHEFDHEDFNFNPSDSDPFSPRSVEFSDFRIYSPNVLEIEEDRGVEIGGSDSESGVPREEPVIDLVERPRRGGRREDEEEFLSNSFAEEPFFRVCDEDNEVGGSDYLQLVGLELGFSRLNYGREGQEESGFMIEECDNDFFVGRRSDSVGESIEIRTMEQFGNCLRVIGIRSDAEEEEEEEGILGVDFRDDDGFDQGEDDLDIPLCWDSLRLEDQREPNGEFEWEEVENRVDERDVLSIVIDADEEISVTDIPSAEVIEGREEMMRNLEWEVLLAVNNMERNPGSEHEIDHEDYIYPAEYDMIFGQFAQNESALRGSPPAAKSVIENLPSIVLTQEEIQNKSGLCAVCKDEISTEENAKILPCSHYYHGDCILPWLNIRNTCPVCRFELPTDDLEYERRT